MKKLVMPSGLIISRRAGFAVVVALVLARCAAPLYWSDVYFDADQAVTGLMAKHIAEGRAFPVMQYGMSYVLVLESYLAAPLLAISESSLVLLRLVPVAFNLAAATILYGILTSAAQGLSPPLALLATAPVALTSVAASAELTEALGMNIEPLFFSLVLWLLRRQPIALGVVAAIGMKNREFVLYAVAALLALDLLRDRSAVLWRPRVAGLVAFAVTWSLIGVVHQHSSWMGPGSTVAMLGSAGSNVAVAANAVCIAPERMPQDIAMVASELLPLQWGLRSVHWRNAGHPGAQPPDASWLWIPLVAALTFGAARGVFRAWTNGPAPLSWFGAYLVMIGLQAVIVYMLTRCGNASFFTTRYTLLSIFIAAGAIVLALERERSTAVRSLVIAVCVWWMAVVVAGHVAVLRGFVAAPPQGGYRQLATYLEEHQIRFIRADYWTGYHVAFLTGERVRALTNFDRILDHQQAVRANMEDSVEVRRRTEPACDGAVVVGPFYVCDQRPRTR